MLSTGWWDKHSGGQWRRQGRYQCSGTNNRCQGSFWRSRGLCISNP